MTATETAIDLARTAAQAAVDKHGEDISIFDVSDRLPLTDCFVVVTATNERQVGAIVDEVTERMRLVGVKALRREGERDGRWVLLDFSDIVVHVQHSEERVFYALDRLWRDCPVIPFTDAALDADGSRGDEGADNGASVDNGEGRDGVDDDAAVGAES